MDELFTLQTPTGWAEQPGRWSTTTLNGIGECPRRWQLSRSAWGRHSKFPERYHPAAVEGIIVHDGLDLLSRSCGRHGRPSIGTPHFQQAIDDSDFFGFFSSAIEQWNTRLRSHPRHGPLFSLKVSPQELANRAIRLFRAQYHPTDGRPATRRQGDLPTQLDARGLQDLLTRLSLLSELELHHPSLSFMGKVDRIQVNAGAVEIVDFKSGAPKPGHRTQLERYALLWWRNTGVIPAQGTAQYLDTKTSWPLAESDLVRTEETLTYEIESATGFLDERPATPKVGQSCRFCPVRARCAEGWAHVDAGKVSNGNLDLEVKVVSEPSSVGFLARSRGGQEVNVVHHKAIMQLLPPIAVGDVVRIVGGRGTAKSKELEIRAWTETYQVEDGD